MPEMRTEVQLGGTWIDVSHRVYDRDPVEISAGRRDWGARTDPSKLTLTLNNRDGWFSPRNPMSPYYGQLTRNTPLRMSVPGGDSYLALTGDPGTVASAPALGITGDIDVRAEVEIDWDDTAANQTLLGQWGADGNRAWVLRVFDGFLVFNWTANGLVANQFGVSHAISEIPRRAAVRATLDADNGAGGHTVNLYWAYSLDGPWSQLGGPVVGTGTTSVYDSTAPLEIAPSATDTTPDRLPFTGSGHRFEVRDGIDGTAAASPDFRALAPGTTAWTDSAGLDWTAPPGAVQDRDYIFHGEVASWPTRWETSGSDVYVPLQAAGIQRRLKQGRKALESTLRRRIPAGGPIAYWPMEDGENATVCYSPLDGVSPMSVSGLDFAAEDSLGGSAALPTLQNPAAFAAPVPASSASGWQAEAVYLLPQMPASETQILRVVVAGSVCRYATVYASTAGIKIEARDEDDTVIGFFTFTDADAVADFWNVWNRLAIYVSDEGGGDTRLTVRFIKISDGTYWRISTLYTGTMGRATAVTGTYGAATDGMSLGHLAVFDEAGIGNDPGNQIFDGADDGYTGETAILRLRRLATEETGTPITVYDGDFTTDSEQLGPQKPASLLDLLYQAAETDGGILYEDRRRLALVYRDRSSLYNQTPAMSLDYASSGGGIVSQLDPVDDDQAVRNDITVTRDGGSSGRAVDETSALSVLPPPDGIGRYDEEITLSLATDAQPEPIAHWRLHLGTWDEARYPQIRLRLHAAGHLVADWLRLRIGDRITIANPPAWLPPDDIDLIVQGYEQRLTLTTWDVTLTCTPARPWQIGVVEDEVLGRVDTDGSELAGHVSATDTTLYVQATIGPDWTTDPTDLPWDLRVGGEVMTVTDVDAPGSVVMDADGDGSTTAATSHVAPSVTATGSADLLICAWIPWDHYASVYTIPESMTERAQTTGTWSRLADATEELTGAGATGTRTATRTSSDAWAAISVLVSGAPTGTPTVEEHLTGVSGAGEEVSLTTAAETQAGWWLVTLQGWDNNDPPATGGPSGSGWTLLAATSPVDAAAPYIVAHARKVTTAGAQQVDFPAGPADDNQARVYVLSGVTDLTGQTMTVTRSVNGITKSHTAGSDVRLATPTIVAL